MAARVLDREDWAGLAVAAALHAGLLALLVLHPAKPPLVAPPEPISVTLSDDVGLTSTAHQPQGQPAIAAAPEVAPVPEPMPVAEPEASPLPQRRMVPDRAAALVATPRPEPRVAPAPRAAAHPPAASRISSDFLKGVAGPPTAHAASQGQQAAAIGPAVRNSLAGAISRQLKPHWAAPQGADAEKLITILSFDLNPDGSLAGPPRLVNQDGIDDANRPQAARHAEQAKRAVQLAAPFTLPPEYYTAWKHVASFRFDRRLSQ